MRVHISKDNMLYAMKKATSKWGNRALKPLTRTIVKDHARLKGFLMHSFPLNLVCPYA